MAFFTIDGTLVDISAAKRIFGDFGIYDHLSFRTLDGAEKRLERAIGVPTEVDEILEPALQGRFYAYSIGFFGRRGLFAVRTEAGDRRVAFRVPGEGLLLPMGILCTILVVFIPFAIVFFGQYAAVRTAKRDVEAAWKAEGN